MKIGINKFTHNLAGTSPAETLQRWADLGIRAEELGFWSLWVTEHHFGSDPAYRPYGVPEEEFPPTDYDMSADPLAMLLYLAGRTSTLRLGTAVTILHWDHPIRVAERAALLDVFSGGRLELGVGRGAGWREFEVFNVPKDDAESNRKFKEAIEIIREAWTGEMFEHHGEFWTLPPLILTPNPGRPAPIYVGSASPSSAIYAGEQGLPYATITWPLTELDHYREKRRVYRDAAARAGHDVEQHDIPHILFLHCAETDAQARAEAREYLMQFQYITEAHYEFARRQPRTWLGRDTESLANVEALAQFPCEYHVVGSPETCRQRLEWFQSELDVTYVIGNIGFGRMPHDMELRSLELFAEKVMPHFANAAVVS